MTRSRHSNKKFRAEVFRLGKGCCHICGGAIQIGQAWEIEDVIPLAMGGADTIENKAPAHIKCHAEKTKDDVSKIAKAKRVEASHLGIKRPKGQIKSRGFDKKPRPEKLPLPAIRPMFQ